MSDPILSFAHRFLGRADGAAAAAGGGILQVDADSFNGFHTTTAVVPVYTTFPLAVSLTTTRANSLLHIYAYIAWNVSGGAVRTANFRFRRNGVLIPASRATSSATASGQIATNSYSRLLAVTAGVHAITFEWAKQAGAGTLTVRTTPPGILPDVFGANLKVEEYAA